MKKCILTVLLALLAVFNLMGAEKSPFQWSAVVQEVKSGRWKVRVLCQIAEKSYLYTGATKVSVTLADGNTADIKLPPGVPDKSGETIYRPGAVSFVMFAKSRPVRVTADFQGCTSGGENDVCLMPESRVLWGEFAANSSSGVAQGGFLSGSLQKFSAVKTLSGLEQIYCGRKFRRKGGSSGGRCGLLGHIAAGGAGWFGFEPDALHTADDPHQSFHNRSQSGAVRTVARFAARRSLRAGYHAGLRRAGGAGRCDRTQFRRIEQFQYFQCRNCGDFCGAGTGDVRNFQY